MLDLTSKSFIGITAGIIALVSAGWMTLTTSDAEIKTYIKNALVNGCRPVIDICSSDCKSKDIRPNVRADCMPSKVLRANPERVLGLYLQMGKEAKAKNVSDIPEAIRQNLRTTKGVVLQPLKENLIK